MALWPDYDPRNSDFLFDFLITVVPSQETFESTSMSPISRNSKFAFLAVSEIEDFGYCGGLLMLGPSGRPLEFHCTAPVTANRAQQILYGATLKEFLMCDQIGSSLLAKASAKPDVVLVDDRDILAIGKLTSTPLVFVDRDETRLESGSFEPGEFSQLEVDGQSIFGIDNQALADVEPLLHLFSETLPLSEPFGRIYEAINEAHKDAA